MSHFSSKDSGREIVALSEDTDYQSVLQRVIDSSSSDPAFLRALVYELARIKLRQEARQTFPLMSSVESLRQSSALETAINRVEKELSGTEEPLRISFDSDLPPIPLQQSYTTSVVLDPYPNIEKRGQTTFQKEQIDVEPRKRKPPRWLIAAVILVLIVLAGMVFAPYAVLLNTMHQNQQTSSLLAEQIAINKTDRLLASKNASEAKSAIASQTPGIPLPRSFGVYAVSQGRLFQLETLPGRVADERILVGPVFKTSSQTELPDGKIAFVAFRRDLASIPDQVTVRIVPRISRALTFEGGKPITEVDGSWTIRGGKSYSLRVAPLGDDQQMLLMTPEKGDFSFPAGRYALVLKNQAYDFTVAGAIVDPMQCLERIEAANGTVFSACRDPAAAR